MKELEADEWNTLAEIGMCDEVSAIPSQLLVGAV